MRLRKRKAIMCATCRGKGWVWTPHTRDNLAHKVKCTYCRGKGWRKA